MDVIKVVFRYILMYMCTVRSMGTFEVHHGVITVQGFNTCTVMNNNSTYVHNGVTRTQLPGYWFGLVKYHCDHVMDSVISKMTCKDCGLYCVYNQYIEGCQQKDVEFWSGVGVGVLLSAIIVTILAYFSYKLTGTAVYVVNYLLALCNDRRSERRAEEITKMTGVPAVPLYKDRKLLKESQRDKITGRRNNRTAMSGVAPDVTSIEMDNFVSSSEQDSEPQGTSNRSNAPSPTSNVSSNVYPSITTAAIATLLLAPNSSVACDMTLYLTSHNQICTSSTCTDISVFNFPLMTGQTVCFKDTNGDVFEVKMSTYEVRTRYNLMYYTSSFNGSQSSIHVCGGDSACEVDDGICATGAVHSNFKHIKDKAVVQGYGCKTMVTKCDTYCWRDGSCAFYHWWIKPVGAPLPVYKAIGKTWEVMLTTSYKGIKEMHRMGTTYPTKDMEGFFENKVLRVPISIISMMSKEVLVDNGAIVYKEAVYPVNIADRNMPQHNILGDYQISLEGDKATYDESQIQCHIINCKAECLFPEPKVDRLISNIESQKKILKFNHGQNTEVLDTFVPIHGSILVMLGNVEFNNLQVEKAECDIDIVMTYGCVSCEDSPYIIFNTYNIKRQGIIPFSSNCSFDRSYLSCNTEPYVLTLKDNSKYCYLHMIDTNRTIYVQMDFKYLGTLTPSKIYAMKDDTVTAIKHIATSDEFLRMVGNTAIYCSILGTTLTIAVRLMNLYMYKRTIDSAREEAKP